MNVNLIVFTFVIYKMQIMKERILEFLRKENKTSAQFAEEIGVQPSGISHIISGRNNPSLDFVLKMLEKYSYLSADWLLFGKGSIYKETKVADLFSGLDFIENKKPIRDDLVPTGKEKAESRQESVKKIQTEEASENEVVNVTKIVWFYDNGSFEEFYPRKN
jgi:transcriptional regulator with XRE-family HTH domain